MTSYRNLCTRIGLGAVGVATIGLAVAAPASAHVTVRPDNNATGSYSKITVRVPNESDTAGTVRIQLDLPTKTPFPSVRVQPHAGWTAELTTETFAEPVTVGDYTLDKAVTSVAWTAEEGVRIGPGEFDEFAISVGPLPEPGTYSFPATQVYDDGKVVEWATEPVDGGEEPQAPAPQLRIVEAGNEDGGQHGASHDRPDPHAATDADAGVPSSDSLARGIGVGGVVIGAAGLGFGAMALRRRNA